jgi:lysylphosphatidylglycerol synthetase-like protein (DUF2156 family)
LRWAHIDLFRSPTTTRWFYGTVGEKVVGVLSTLRLEKLKGHLLEHILWLPEAPVGTSEALVAHALETLAGENCTYASFGPAPAHDLGEISGFSQLREDSCRLIYRMARHLFQLNSKTLRRQKYRPVAAQTLYLAFDSGRIGFGTLAALATHSTFPGLSPPRQGRFDRRRAMIEAERSTRSQTRTTSSEPSPRAI